MFQRPVQLRASLLLSIALGFGSHLGCKETPSSARADAERALGGEESSPGSGLPTQLNETGLSVEPTTLTIEFSEEEPEREGFVTVRNGTQETLVVEAIDWAPNGAPFRVVRSPKLPAPLLPGDSFPIVVRHVAEETVLKKTQMVLRLTGGEPVFVKVKAKRVDGPLPPQTGPPSTGGEKQTSEDAEPQLDAGWRLPDDALRSLATLAADGLPEVRPPSICADAHNTGCYVFVPGGTFLMGAQAQDPGAPGYDSRAQPNEGPPHKVKVEPFWISKYETTSSEYSECVRDGGCTEDELSTAGGFSTYGKSDRRTHPINSVTWKGAMDFCAWRGGRLPGESEWEFAARGTDGRPFPWGSEPHCGVAPRLMGGARVSGDEAVEACQNDGPVDVADERKESPYGALGMAGNVWEWTADLYVDRYPTAGDTGAPPHTTERVQRGGGWTEENPSDLRATARGGLPGDQKLNDVGFRCVWPG